jgi:hypothetical protein
MTATGNAITSAQRGMNNGVTGRGAIKYMTGKKMIQSKAWADNEKALGF